MERSRSDMSRSGLRSSCGGSGGLKGVRALGEGDRDGSEKDGMCFERPDVSASRMVERSAKIGGPGDGVRKIGAWRVEKVIVSSLS